MPLTRELLTDPSPRMLAVAAGGGSAALLAGALFFQALGFAPCELCILQRWPHAAAAALAVAIAALGFKRVLAVLGLIAALLLWFARRRERIGHALRRGVAIVGVLVALVLASSLIDFDSFFTLFHGLFFEAGTWTFYAGDTLIQLYPLPFWMNAVLVYGALVLVGVALTYALSFLFRARRSHPEAA